MAKKEKNIQTLEIEAATVEEAIRKSLKRLKAKKQEVTITVLNEGHRGLFGMEGAEPARVRATLKSSK